jgi:hypothetical protein
MALAAQILATGRGVNGSAFLTAGMSSSIDPMFLDDRAYRHAENVLNRGGALSTRPGYVERHTLPDGILQGASYFRPLSGEGTLVVAISGLVYKTTYPFTTYEQIPGIAMYAHAPRVWFSMSTRSAERNADGTIQTIEPRRTLVIQDGGFTRAAYWDGVSAAHSNPTLVLDGDDVLTAGIPLGSVTVWSGGRLWVARDNKLFASDIEDPLSFTENEYLGEGGFFVFEDDITAMAEVPSLESPTLLVFTRNKTYRILSGIRERDLWKSTRDFQSIVLPDIGCVGQRAIVAQNGQLWWMTEFGITNLNAAQQAQVSSRLIPLDTELAVSKANLWSDLSGVALGSFENFLVCSVPYGDRYNAHTWVHDDTVAPGSQAWAGIWTGTRPVEWISGVCGGSRKIFHVSKDRDGKNRLWEAFQRDRRDNGNPIKCWVETKTHIDFSQKATGLDQKEFIFGEVTLGDILGTVDLTVYWAGTVGKYKKIAEYQLEATRGSLGTDTTIPLAQGITTNRGQGRRIRTPEVNRSQAQACSSCGVEAKTHDWVDVGFSLLIVWSGQATLRSYRIFADPHEESASGKAQFDETGPKVVAGALCPS